MNCCGFTYEFPERQYTLTTPLPYRKKRGQYFTPPEIARLMAKWVLKSGSCTSVLDPAAGLGIFFRQMLSICDRPEALELTGYEIDGDLAFACGEAVNRGAIAGLDIRNTDFLLCRREEKYDAVICNPPYIKYREYKQKRRLLDLLEQKTGLRLSGFTNLYVLFLLKSIYLLKPGGRGAFIVPSEFLNSDYGVSVKRHLSETGDLKCAGVFDINIGLFGQAATTSSILLVEKDGVNAGIDFIYMKRPVDLLLLERYIDSYPSVDKSMVPLSGLKPDAKEKWHFYYNPPVSVYSSQAVFSKYARVTRGIATGCNEFFTFSGEKALRYGISPSHLSECVCKSTDIDSSFLTPELFEALKKKGRPVFLLNVGSGEDDALQSYIRMGERRGFNRRYLTRVRSPWYAMEKREPSPILATVFNRGGLRFIRNEAGIRNLTAFHCIYIHPEYEHMTDLITAYLLSGLSRKVLNRYGREYGNGLRKFEPRDLSNSMIPDFEAIGPGTAEDILSVYYAFRNKELAGKEVSGEAAKLDGLFSALLGELSTG